MTAEEFIKKLVDLMDTDAEINLSTKLADVEDWRRLRCLEKSSSGYNGFR